MNNGTSFLREKKYLGLRVPSVIIPNDYNIVLNPLHPEIHQCEIIETIPFVFDHRVFGDAD